jgi:hypothetical protein
MYGRKHNQNSNTEGKLILVLQQRIKLITTILILGILLPALDPFHIGFEFSFIVLIGSQ